MKIDRLRPKYWCLQVILMIFQCVAVVRHYFPAKSHLQTVLFSVQLTGGQTIVTAKLGDDYFTVCEDKEYEETIDQRIKIRVDLSRTSLFEASNSNRIRFN
jgi:hypothetical protein